VTSHVPAGVAASVALGDLLSGPRTPAAVRGVSGPACYLDADGLIVVVEGADGAGLPNAVRVTHPARPPLRLGIGDQVVLGGGGLVVGGRELLVHRWWDPYVRIGSSRIGAADVAVATATLRSAARSVDAGSVPPLDSSDLAWALRARNDADLAAAATALLGRGPGLTPAGDDVLAGLLAALRVLGPSLPAPVGDRVAATADILAAAVTGAAPERTTALSAQLLAHAARGAVALPVADVLRAVAGRGGLVASAARLARVGHTSGGDLLVGIALAVDIMLPESEGTRAHA